MSMIKIGDHTQKELDELESHESVQFVDLPGNPRVRVVDDRELEISFDSGVGGVCVQPIAGNVIRVSLRNIGT